MTIERIHNVYRLDGERAGRVGVGSENRALAGGLAAYAAEAAEVSVPGRWIVRDHTDTILALCGPMGRAG